MDLSKYQLKAIKESPKGKLPKFLEQDKELKNNSDLENARLRIKSLAAPKKLETSAGQMNSRLGRIKQKLGYLH